MNIQSLLDEIKAGFGNKNELGFNLFSALQLETDEVRTHSRMLSELLRPDGANGYGLQFLEKFLVRMGADGLFPDLLKLSVFVEKSVGAVTEFSGGQIDIYLIGDHCNCLIIENKIYAGDQPNQLLRYRHFALQQERRGGKTKVLYLTLYGNCASGLSVGSENNHDFYECISYKSNIINWLTECLDICSKDFYVSTAIQHYLHLIKKLTGMNNDELISNTSHTIIATKENFRAAQAVESSMLVAKSSILKEEIQRVTDKLIDLFPAMQFEIPDNFGYQYEGMIIRRSGLDADSAHVRFSFLSNAADCYIEIHPGLLNGKALDKVSEKQQQYQQSLNVQEFPNNVGKIMNTVNYWQGEWVMHYYLFNDRFEEMIDKNEVLTNHVVRDLSIVIAAFCNMEQYK